MKPQTITIWRDSVAAGDDVFAPHELKIEIEENETIETTLGEILTRHYLASIQGGKATWIVVGKTALAVIAQQWAKPQYLIEKTLRTKDVLDDKNEWHLDFRYWGQADPDEVIESIKQGKPLPDRYSAKH